MVPDVDIESLRLIVDIAQHGSVSAAAARRGISQPAASARLREFESRWGLAVVRRSPRGSSVTTDGEVVVNWARQVLHAVDTMRSSLVALSDQRGDSLTVAASLTVAEQLLPRWLGELHSGDEDIHALLHVTNSEGVLGEIREGTADIGFIESPHIPTDLTRRTVGRDRLGVIVLPSHPWARRKRPLQIGELRSARWVLREIGSGTRSTFQRALGAEPALALEATSTTTLIGAVLAGVGPAVVPLRSISAEVETGRVVVVPTDLDLLRPLTAVWRRGERLPSAATALLSIAVRAV